MGIHIETQSTQEAMQVRSRELQIENTEKLNDIIPIVEDIENIDLNKIESNTQDIKDMIIENLDNQTNLDDILDAINSVGKNISTVKGQVTKLSKKVEALENKITEE